MNTNGMYNSALAKKPTINHTNKTITVSDKFFRAASDPFSNEAADIMLLREKFPGYAITTRTHRSPRKTEKSKNIKKFVSYEHMEKYIKLLPDSEKLLEQLKTVKAYADAHNYAASIVFKWFNDSFPDYHKNLIVDETGKLHAKVNVISIKDLKKKAELPQAADPQDTDTLQEVV